VAGRIGEGGVRVLLHAEVTTGRWLAIERRGEYAVLDRHPLRAAIQKYIKAGSAPRRGHVPNLVRGQLDGQDGPPCAEAKDLRGGVLIHRVDGVIGDDVASGRREVGDEKEMAGEERQAEVEAVGDAATLLGTDD